MCWDHKSQFGTPSKVSGLSITYSICRSRCGLMAWFLVFVFVWLVGCGIRTRPSEGKQVNAICTSRSLISREQAKAIAQTEVEKVDKGAFKFHARLVDTPYWRVVIESQDGGTTRYLTNFLPGMVSGSDAGIVAHEWAKKKLGDTTSLHVRSTEFHREPCWRVEVSRVPSTPDGSFVVTISAWEGTIMDPL